MTQLKVAGLLTTRGDQPLGDRCPVDRAMRVVGNRTALLLMREVFYGASRFEQLTRRVGVTDGVAAQRLRELVSAGLLTKRPYREEGRRSRQEYVLTEAGHALLPALLALFEWGETYATRGAGVDRVSRTLTHADCGARVHVVARCDEGHDVPESELVVSTGGGRS
jgi:DNA-binding HxlR family transcriptional regulator